MIRYRNFWTHSDIGAIQTGFYFDGGDEELICNLLRYTNRPNPYNLIEYSFSSYSVRAQIHTGENNDLVDWFTLEPQQWYVSSDGNLKLYPTFYNQVEDGIKPLIVQDWCLPVTLPYPAF